MNAGHRKIPDFLRDLSPSATETRKSFLNKCDRALDDARKRAELCVAVAVDAGAGRAEIEEANLAGEKLIEAVAEAVHEARTRLESIEITLEEIIRLKGPARKIASRDRARRFEKIPSEKSSESLLSYLRELDDMYGRMIQFYVGGSRQMPIARKVIALNSITRGNLGILLLHDHHLKIS